MPLSSLVLDSNILDKSPETVLKIRREELGTWAKVAQFYDVTEPTIHAWRKINVASQTKIAQEPDKK